MTALDNLRALAEAATPGPWLSNDRRAEHERHQDEHGFCVENGAGLSITGWGCVTQSRENADYIAALSPERILAMIRCIEAAKAVRYSCVIGPAAVIAELDAAFAELERD